MTVEIIRILFKVYEKDITDNSELYKIIRSSYLIENLLFYI